MVRHWLRKRGPKFRTKLFFNAIGAVTTAIVLVIIIVAKFQEGAWMIVIVAPALVLLLRKINKHFRKIGRQVGQAINLRTSDITAVQVSKEGEDKEKLRKLGKENVENPAAEAHATIPRLEILDSPYRQISKPVTDFVNKIAKQDRDRLLAVIIPELIEPHWYEYLLHNFLGAQLKARLFLNGHDRVVVINTPWALRE